MSKTYLITWAQNATRVHKGFWASAQTFARARKANIIVIPGRYKNPTSPREAARLGEEVWAPEVTPNLVFDRKSVCRNLRIYADIKIQPTAEFPLNGFEVFLGRNSGIFGHPKRQLTVVPAGDSPRVMFSTGACTIKNYSDSKAGKKGHAHHVIGGLVVEVDADGMYFCRHVTASGADGSFTDLDTRYTPTRTMRAARAESVTMGDWHSGTVEELAKVGTRALIERVRPKFVVGHDWLSFRTRNHHERNKRSQYAKRDLLVEDEVEQACREAAEVAAWGDHELAIVRSNHDEAFERWLEECDPERDPVNAPYYHAMWSRAYEHFNRHGRWPNLFEYEFRRLQPKGGRVRFLKRKESLKLGGVEHKHHSDKGPNGTRGSLKAFYRLGFKSNLGHGHTPGIMGPAWMGGTMGLDQGYNTDCPSSWLVAHIVTLADGKRQMVIVVKGRFAGGQTCRNAATRSSTGTTTAKTTRPAKAA